jgi:hypothetical protein
MKRLACLILLAGCSKAPPEGETLAFQSLGAFEYAEKMKLPADVARWNGKFVKTTGFINPMSQTRNLTAFLLVRDRASCCFGKMPQINHYIDVKLKPGATANYSTDLVTIQGVLRVEERFDGDWPLGLYWMEGAEVLK